MKNLMKVSLVFGLFYIFLMYSPSLLDFRPKAYSLPFPEFKGSLEENGILSRAEHLFPGVLHGPESMVFHKGDLYTGVADGRIVKIKDGKVITVARTGRNCEFPVEERLCGRPLGLRIGKDGLLYVIDAYYGIFQMNFTTGDLTLILPSATEVQGHKLEFPDDLDMDDKGNIYFSDASQKWDLTHIFYLMLEYDDTGRIIRYNMHSKKADVLVSNLHFPNGVQLSKDESTLLICEIMSRRILRYHLKGSKKGQVEVFADNLPAEPDNIRRSSRGYWVGFTSARNSSNPLWVDYMNSFPGFKRVWARFHYLLATIMVKVSDMVAHPGLREFSYKFKRGDYYLHLFPRHGIIMEFDENGNILRSFHSPDGKTSDLSEVKEHDGYLYLGSFMNKYLGRLKL